ncbi:MAG TPA: polymer-forming cytoskeletal protein [Polyangiaceae bacterium]|nr:polymer-forming cytoskeletal protein [Polyangiaceae bacterium]
MSRSPHTSSRIARSSKALLACLALLLFAAPNQARAEVRRSGSWPGDERVSLSLHGASRSQAVRALAAAAKWNLVAHDLGEQSVDVEVTDQPAARVLELLLDSGQFVAEREGNLISIHAAEPPVTAPGAAAAKPSFAPGQDRVITGSERIAPGEVVGDLFVWRGSVVIEGTVNGSVVVFGGTAQFLSTAYVKKDVIAFGGSLDLKNGVRVDGEVSALFGKMTRGDQVQVVCSTCMYDSNKSFAGYAKTFAERLAGASLLWIVGALLLAFASSRAEAMRAEMLARPLRSIGLGVGVVLGFALVILTLVVTLIGIPLAVLVGLFSALVGYLAFCMVPFALGSRLFGRRSQNPYVHLALGCTGLFLVQLIPGIGDLLSVLAALWALGALAATRGAGLLPRRRGSVNAAPIVQ